MKLTARLILKPGEDRQRSQQRWLHISCFAFLATVAGGIQAQDVRQVGDWLINVRYDPITDENHSLIATVNADTTWSLYVLCVSEESWVGVLPSTSNTDGRNRVAQEADSLRIEWRFDRYQPKTGYWYRFQAGLVLPPPVRPRIFLDNVALASRVAIRVHYPDAPPSTPVFDISGFEEAYASLRECEPLNAASENRRE